MVYVEYFGFLVRLHECCVGIKKYGLVGSICVAGGGARILLLYVHCTRTEVPKWQLYLYKYHVQEKNTPYKYYLPSRSFCCVYAELCTRRRSSRRRSSSTFCSRSLHILISPFFFYVSVFLLSLFLPCHKIFLHLFAAGIRSACNNRSPHLHHQQSTNNNNNNNNNALSQKKSSIPSKSFCWWFVCFNCVWFSVGTKERAGILLSFIDQQTTTTTTLFLKRKSSLPSKSSWWIFVSIVSGSLSEVKKSRYFFLDHQSTNNNNNDCCCCCCSFPGKSWWLFVSIMSGSLSELKKSWYYIFDHQQTNSNNAFSQKKTIFSVSILVVVCVSVLSGSLLVL